MLENTNNMEDNTVESNKEEVVNAVKKKDVNLLSFEELLQEIKSCLQNEKVVEVKEDVKAIKNAFNKKFNTFIQEKKKEFIAEGGNEIDFKYDFPLRKEFFSLVNEFSDKIKSYYNQKEKERKDNYTKKLVLIEELKNLIVSSEKSTMYTDLKKIQDVWKSIGSVPFDKNEDIWRTFRFHEQKVYDFLHLQSDFRNLDFKHNLEKKTKIVARAEELAQDNDVQKAFKELQILHRLWKEEIGPVAREFSEDIWEKFSNATKIIHDKRRLLFSELEKKYEENVPKKEAVIAKINQLVSVDISSHKAWQDKIKELEKLRNQFFSIGKVSEDKQEQIWESFREATRNFNHLKNSYYKEIKQQHQSNLEKKQALVAKAQELKDSDDLEATTEVFKKIQSDWKKIGHVPRKFSDSLWKEFKEACNHFFDRLHQVQDEENKELTKVFEEKKTYFSKVKEEVQDVEKVELDKIKEFISNWKEYGQVPNNMRFIDAKFNKFISKLFTKLDMDKNEAMLIQFRNNIDSFVEQNNERKLNNEILFIRRKMDEISKEIKLQENNLGFFKHTDANNPLLKNVHKNMEKYKDELQVWKKKFDYIKNKINN